MIAGRCECRGCFADLIILAVENQRVFIGLDTNDNGVHTRVVTTKHPLHLRNEVSSALPSSRRVITVAGASALGVAFGVVVGDECEAAPAAVYLAANPGVENLRDV